MNTFLNLKKIKKKIKNEIKDVVAAAKGKTVKINSETKKITNLDINKITINDIKEQIANTIGIVKEKITKIVDYTGKEITDLTKKIGTGTKITIDGKGEYTAILYGDCNGDGKINSLDALAIVKNNLGKVTFKADIFEEAGRAYLRSKNKRRICGCIQ